MVKGITSISPMRKPRPAAKCSDLGSSGIAPSSSRTARLQAWWVGAVRKTGTFSFVASRCKPATWSECSCVIRIAESSSVRSPSARSRLKVSRPDRPASTSIRVELVATSAQFPRLPLASTDTDTHITVAYPHRLWKREQFFTGRYLWWELPPGEVSSRLLKDSDSGRFFGNARLGLPKALRNQSALSNKCPPVSEPSGRASLVTVSLGERSRYCLSYTEIFLTFLPAGSVPLVVTVRVLPSADTTIRPVTVTFPPFFAVNCNVWSSTFFNDRVSELGSPVTG